MNERIKQLAKEAGFKTDEANLSFGNYIQDKEYFYADNFIEDELKKFAELIVKECVAQIRPMWNHVKEVGAPPGYDYDTFDLAYNDCMNAIKEHFGVEE